MTCTPGCSQRARRYGSRAGVVVTTTSLSRTTNSGVGHTVTSTPSSHSISSAYLLHLVADHAVHEEAFEVGARGAGRASDSEPAMPEPMTPADSIVARRQVPRRDRPGQAGAQVGEKAVVDEQRLQEAGLGADAAP